MNTSNSNRKELSQFLAENASAYLIHLEIISVQRNSIFDIHVVGHELKGDSHMNLLLRIFAHDAIDYAIRPKDPGFIMGGARLKFSTDDPRLKDPRLQCIPGGDGEVFDPPRRYQLLELDQTYIIACRFEVEELHRRIWSIPRPGQSQSGAGGETAIKEHGS
jgi:hypothetical protein